MALVWVCVMPTEAWWPLQGWRALPGPGGALAAGGQGRGRNQGGIHPVFAESGRPDYSFLSCCSRLTGSMRRRRCFWLVLLGCLIPVIACCFWGSGGKVNLDVGLSGLYSGLKCQHRISRCNSSEMNFSSRFEVADYAFWVCRAFNFSGDRLKSDSAACQARTRQKGTERVQTLFASCVSMVGPEGFEPPTKRL